MRPGLVFSGMDMRVLARNDYILIAVVALSALAGVIALIVAVKSLWEVWQSRSEGPEEAEEISPRIRRRVSPRRPTFARVLQKGAVGRPRRGKLSPS